MDQKTFEKMFGKLRKQELSNDELNLVQKYHPQTFKGYIPTMLQEIATNPALNSPNKAGYEGMFDATSKIFSPENPEAFGQFMTNNIRKMDPYSIKKLFDYVQWLNQAQDKQSQGGPR